MIADIEMWNFHGGFMVGSIEARQLHGAGSSVTISERQCQEGLRSCQSFLASSRFARPVAVLGVAIAVGLLTGCTGGGSPETEAGPTTPAMSAPPQDARGSAEELALNAYRGMWSAYAKAGLTANPDEPDLAKHASGTALATLREGLSNARRDGHVIKGELGATPQVTEVNLSNQPATVSIADCLNTEKFLTYTSSGDLVDDESGGRRLTKATATNLGTGEGWKVTGLGIQAVGTCS
ncbi:hypothetical protein ACIG87_26530 [Micromonospora sp. NPDC051925]|uniref:hypothetical protein n=1 Tax=Micromonospora sp. NPDC051925 TaxID=3364288 RepID=UPI0037C7E978